MNMYDELRKELDKQIPEIAEQYISNVESFFSYLKKTYGDCIYCEGNAYSHFKGEDGSWVSHRMHEKSKEKFRNYSGRGIFVNLNPPEDPTKGRSFYGKEEHKKRCQNFKWILNKEPLMPEALEYAENAVRKWEMKIMDKLGDLEEIEVPYYQGNYYVISGKRNGQDVSINQQMIVNYRYETHAVFNQFPARIYVDGKSMSESAYKKHFNN